MERTEKSKDLVLTLSHCGLNYTSSVVIAHNAYLMESCVINVYEQGHFVQFLLKHQSEAAAKMPQ